MSFDNIELRASIRNRRKQLSSDAVAQASSQISEKIMHLPEFLSAKKIAYYLPHENEIDLSVIACRAKALNKSLYLPILKNKNELLFYRIDIDTRFEKNKWGIEEPIVLKELSVSPDTFDLILMPLVAFDTQGNRLGRGIGCYDRCLAFTKKPILMGVAYEFQKVDTIIPESWDVSMDYIVTEKSVYSAAQ